MADTEIPPWFNLLREDIAAMRKDFNDRLDRLVSRDAFQQEQQRVNEKFDDQGRDIGRLRTDLEKEVQVRVISAETAARERAAEQSLREREAGNRRWGVLAWFASPLISAAVAWVAATLIANGGSVP